MEVHRHCPVEDAGKNNNQQRKQRTEAKKDKTKIRVTNTHPKETLRIPPNKKKTMYTYRQHILCCFREGQAGNPIVLELRFHPSARPG